jgi:WD40 repeat-containing protein SMU1
MMSLVIFMASQQAGKTNHTHNMQVHEKGAIGLSHHPHRNLIASWAEEGPLKCWKPV